MNKLMRKGKYYIVQNGNKKEVTKEEYFKVDEPLKELFTSRKDSTPQFGWKNKVDSWKT